MSEQTNAWDTEDGKRAIEVMENAGIVVHDYQRCTNEGEVVVGGVYWTEQWVSWLILSHSAREYLTARIVWRMQTCASATLIDEVRDGNWYALAEDSDHDAALAKAVLAVSKKEEDRDA